MTVKVQVPAVSPVMVVEAPVPAVVVPPGFRVSVQVPWAGNPFRTTLPVAREQVGCVMVPATGAPGVSGCVLITAFPEIAETHPEASVTVKVKLPGVKPEMVVEVPDPVVVTPPGFRVTIQIPDDGRPFNTTLPVASSQSGWVVVPITGAIGPALTCKV